MARRPRTSSPPVQNTAQQAEDIALLKAEAKRKAAKARLRRELKLFQFYDKQVECTIHTSTIIGAICTKTGVTLYTLEKGERKKYVNIKRSLDSMADLWECGFVRIHQSVMINLAYYKGITTEQEVILTQPIDRILRVSDRYLADFRRTLRSLTY